MELFYHFGHEKTRKIKQLKNLGAKFVKIQGQNGLASFGGGLASSADRLASSSGLMKPVQWRVMAVCQRMKPVVLFLIYIFSSSPFSNVFFLSAAGVLPSESALKTAFSENLC